MKRMTSIFALLAPVSAAASAALAAPSVDPDLTAALDENPLGTEDVIITFAHRPGHSDFTALTLAGVDGGLVLQNLPMVLTSVTQAELTRVAAMPGVVSVYGNETFELYDNVSREFIGQQALLRDREVTFINGGVPVSGKGVGVAVVDTGIDATHADLQLGENVVQNVLFPLALAPLEFPTGFVAPIFVENAPINDVEGGHGTFVAGNIGATGQSSGGFYGGAAPGADLIGLNAGSDAGLSSFAIVQAYDYILANKDRYNIRVVNNSFGAAIGSADAYDPFDPINVGTRALHDDFIAVVYAAGNDGAGPAQINRLCVAPWVICVAAGEKQGLGTPTSFTSHGIDNGSGVNSAPHPADPNQAPNLRPDITGSGANIISTRSKGPGVTNLAGTALGQDLQIPPAFLPFYTTSQGTSFAAPQVAGVVALMLEANPQLTPQQVMELLRETANPMPFEERIVGAGYVDAHNAVRAALNLARVPAPANLFPGANETLIVDGSEDQTGLGAQDIIAGDIRYEPSTDQIVYELIVDDLADNLPNGGWLMQSAFLGKPIFVSASVDELGAERFDYGEFTELPDGTTQQTDLGAADEGAFDLARNTIHIRLARSKIEAAVGAPILGTQSDAVSATSQILIGTSFTGGLLLRADEAAGANFPVGGDNGDDGTGDGTGDGGAGDGDPDDNPQIARCGAEGQKVRFAGAVLAGQSHQATGFTNACDAFDAILTYNPGNAGLTLVLEDLDGSEIARATTANGRKISTMPLPVGDYQLRIEGTPEKSVDYVIQVSQKSE